MTFPATLAIGGKRGNIHIFQSPKHILHTRINSSRIVTDILSYHQYIYALCEQTIYQLHYNKNELKVVNELALQSHQPTHLIIGQYQQHHFLILPSIKGVLLLDPLTIEVIQLIPHNEPITTCCVHNSSLIYASNTGSLLHYDFHNQQTQYLPLDWPAQEQIVHMSSSYNRLAASSTAGRLTWFTHDLSNFTTLKICEHGLGDIYQWQHHIITTNDNTIFVIDIHTKTVTTLKNLSQNTITALKMYHDTLLALDNQGIIQSYNLEHGIHDQNDPSLLNTQLNDVYSICDCNTIEEV